MDFRFLIRCFLLTLRGIKFADCFFEMGLIIEKATLFYTLVMKWRVFLHYFAYSMGWRVFFGKWDFSYCRHGRQYINNEYLHFFIHIAHISHSAEARLIQKKSEFFARLLCKKKIIQYKTKVRLFSRKSRTTKQRAFSITSSTTSLAFRKTAFFPDKLCKKV